MREYIVQANLGAVEGSPLWVTVVPTDGTPYKYVGRRNAWRYMVEHYLIDGSHIEYRVEVLT